VSGDRAPRVSRGRPVLRDAVVVLGVLVVLGAACGLLWFQVVSPAEFTRLARGGSMDEAELARQFGADAWFAVIAVVAGGISGLLLARWRSRDPLLTAALLLVGSVLAAVVMALVGHWLGPGDPRAALRTVAVGARVPERLDVGSAPVWPLWGYLQDTATVYLAWPVAVLLGALFELVGRQGDDSSGPSGDSDISPTSRRRSG
jgi:hypothetical protein